MVVIVCSWQKNKIMLLSVAFILVFFFMGDIGVTKCWCSLSYYCFIMPLMLLIYCCYAKELLGFVSPRFVHKIRTGWRKCMKYKVGVFTFPSYMWEVAFIIYWYMYICKKIRKVLGSAYSTSELVKWKEESMWYFSATKLPWGHHWLLFCSKCFFSAELEVNEETESH